MSSNILSTKENNLKREYPLVDKPYYVDRIAFKVDNSEQWLIDTDTVMVTRHRYEAMKTCKSCGRFQSQKDSQENEIRASQLIKLKFIQEEASKDNVLAK